MALLAWGSFGVGDGEPPYEVSHNWSRRLEADLGRNRTQSSAPSELVPEEMVRESFGNVAANNDWRNSGWTKAGFLGPPYPPPAPRYFSPESLDSPPRALERLEIPLPEGDGVYVLRHMLVTLLIDDSGKVDEVIVESSNLAGADEVALSERFRGIRFVPGMKEGLAVPSRTRVKLAAVSGRPVPSIPRATSPAENR